MLGDITSTVLGDIKRTEFLNVDNRKLKEQKKHLKNVLKELRSHEDRLNTLLETETAPEAIEKLERKMKLAHTQRKKGVTMLKEIQEQKKSLDAGKTNNEG